MHKERPSFKWFHKTIIIEAEESEEDIEASNITNDIIEMSSRGGEASGAAAPGRRRDSAARLREVRGSRGAGRARVSGRA